jgi:O-antigen/teichoic acid export membrane protein
MTTSVSIVPEVKSTNQDSTYFRHHMGRVTSHSAVFFLGTIFNALAAYGFKVYLARTLGASLLGIYALGMTVVSIASIFNTLGVSQAAVRFISSYSATQRFDLLRGFLARSISLLLVCNTVLAIAMLLVGPWVAIHFYHTPELANYIRLFTLIMILGVFTHFFGNVLGGYKDVARRTVINYFIGTPLTILTTVVLVAYGLGLKGYIAAQVISASLVLLLLLILVWRLTPEAARSFSGPLAPIDKETISVSATTLGLALLGFVMSHTDTVAIGRYRNTRELGVYALASAIVTFVCVVLNSVNQIFGPTIADLFAREEHDLLSRMYQTLTKWILGLTLPLAAVILVFAVPIMGIFGKDFEAGWIILVIGTIGQLVNSGVGSSGTLLYMTGRHRSLIWIQASIAFMIIVLNVWLVPVWGIVGAVLASAFANVVANVCYLIVVRRELRLLPYNSSYFRLVLPILGMLCVLFAVRQKMSGILPPWLTIGTALGLGYLVFIAIALVFGLNADDKLIARAIWTRVQGIVPRPEATS